MRKVRFILLSVFLLALAACERDGVDLTLSLGPYGGETRKVMLMYEAGFNTLSSDIRKNKIGRASCRERVYSGV